MRTFLAHLIAQKTCIVAFLSTFSITIAELCGLQFGVLLYKQVFAEDEASKDYVSDRISLYMLIGHLTGWIPSVIFGVLADRVKVWKLMLIAHIFMVASLAVFVASVPQADHIRRKLLYGSMIQLVALFKGYATSLFLSILKRASSVSVNNNRRFPRYCSKISHYRPPPSCANQSYLA